MNLKIDENLPVDAARLLALAGHDVLHVLDEHLGGSPDAEIFRICQLEKRVLVTLDVDFANIQLYPPRDHAGVVVMRLRHQDKSSVMRAIARLAALLNTHSLVQRLWIVDEERVRIREG